MSSEVARPCVMLFDVLFVVVRENDRVVLGVIFAIEAEVHHERRAGEFSLAKGRWFMAAKIFSSKSMLMAVTEVGIDHDVVTVDLFAARKFDAAGTPPIQQYAGYGCGGVNLSAFFAGNLGKGLADSAKSAHDVIHAMRMLRVRDHGEETGTVPRRHPEVF